jgi:hypothetical protein
MQLPKSYQYSRLASLGALMLVLPMLVGLCYMMSKVTWESVQPANWIVWLIAVVYVALLLLNLLLGVMLIRRLFVYNPSLVLAVSGLTDSASKVGEIVWSDIKEASLYHAGRGKTTVKLTLLNADKYWARLSSVSRIVRINWLGKAQLILSISGTNAKADEVLDIIKSQIIQNT